MSAFLKKELEDNGFAVNEIIDNVIIVENFISKDEVAEYLDIINTTEESEWKKEYLDNLVPFCLEKFGRDDVENLVAEGKFEITQNWEDKNLKLTTYPIADKICTRLSDIVKQTNQNLELADLRTFQRMYDGTELKAHTDQDTDPSIRYATIAYLNEDYAGGEIFFTHKNLKLKPKPGSLLIFPGTEEFHHGVTHVEAGPVRYVLVGFIKESNFYENNKY
jgi:hypothetical protein